MVVQIECSLHYIPKTCFFCAPSYNDHFDLYWQRGVICREMLTKETALKADVFALGVTAIHLVGNRDILL